ncbi:hypothetical protein [Embleya sp. NPDC005575]|uniref:hypothetical protein n=1 Tax=Embleya sp. NPDC005575 TaxID=3156892 RepID=UPI0033B44372
MTSAATTRRRFGRIRIRIPDGPAALAPVAPTVAVPGRRVELPVPTGLIRQIPDGDGRDWLAGWDPVLADAYTLAGLAAQITIAVGVPAARRKWASRTAEAVTLDPPEPLGRTAPGNTTPAPARA